MLHPFAQPIEGARPNLQPTIFWRIAEDIPKSLQSSLMVLSVVGPLCFWWALTGSGVVNSQFGSAPEVRIESRQDEGFRA